MTGYAGSSTQNISLKSMHRLSRVILRQPPNGVADAPAPAHSERNASDCNCVISKGLRQRTLVQESLSSFLTM